MRTVAPATRYCASLFADLVGFTPFAEERDSEDVREQRAARGLAGYDSTYRNEPINASNAL